MALTRSQARAVLLVIDVLADRDRRDATGTINRSGRAIRAAVTTLATAVDDVLPGARAIDHAVPASTLLHCIDGERLHARDVSEALGDPTPTDPDPAPAATVDGDGFGTQPIPLEETAP